MDLHRNYLRSFFTLLAQRDLAACDEFVKELDQKCLSDPLLQPWRDYCAAVIVQEQSTDFAQAQFLYTQLLSQSNIPDFLAGQLLVSLAGAEMLSSNFDAALEATRKAIDLFQRIGEPLEEAKALAQHALVYHFAFECSMMGADSLPDGISACRAALDRLNTLPINEETGFIWVQARNTLGQLYVYMLNLDAAIECYETLLQISSQINNAYVGAIANCNLGQCRRRLGGENFKIAHENLQAALETFHRLERDYDEMLTCHELALLFRDQLEPEESLVWFERALQCAEIVRASISDEGFRAGFVVTVSDIYANAVLCAADAGQSELAFRYMEQARSRALLDLLVDASTTTTETGADILALHEVRSRLPKDALLLEYFTTGVVQTADRQKQTGIASERPTFPPANILLFAITAEQVALQRLDLSPNDLNPLSIDDAVHEHFLDESMREVLHMQLIQPIAAHLVGKQTVFVVPHGPLHYVPFQALLDPSGVTLLQQDRFRMIYSPSASVLLRSSALTHSAIQIAQSQARDTATLILGCNGNDQNPLDYAEAEATSIAAITGGYAIVGEVDRIALLIERSKTAQLVHFSCHGGFSAANPLQSFLQIGREEKLTAKQIIDEMYFPNSLLVLSACSSGLSQVRRGDEIYGLVRACFFAGAAAVLSTQWRVDERSTYLLMCKFYERLMAGDDFAQALHSAQLYLQALTVDDLQRILRESGKSHPRLGEVLRSVLDERSGGLRHFSSSVKPFSQPYYWAPFILIYG